MQSTEGIARKSLLPDWLFSRTAGLAICVLLFGVNYWKVLAWLWERAMAADSYYSHAFLIPLISGYLIFKQRAILSRLPLDSSALGLIMIVFALFVHLLSVLLNVYFTSGFSILVFVFGLSLYLLGRKITNQLLFPLGFLVFMFPLPGAFLSAVAMPMKLFATHCGAKIIEFSGIPIVQEGFQLHLASASLVIGNPCSGLRSLIALIALGSLFVYFYKAPVWKRIVFFLASIPAAILSNIVRVALLSLAANSFGSDAATGLFHDISGLLVFGIALGMLFGTKSLLSINESQSRSAGEEMRIPGTNEDKSNG